MRFYAIPAILWTVLVTILCLLPGRDMPKIHIVNFDKFAHLFFFGILNALYLRWQNAYPVLFRNNFLFHLIISVIIILYGGLMEILQGFFYTDRYADFYDFLANASGCILALILFSTLKKYFILRIGQKSQKET